MSSRPHPCSVKADWIGEYRVPLSGAAVAILEAARERHGTTGFVFRSPTGKRIDRLVPVLRAAGSDADVRGFRSSLRGWCLDNRIADTVGERCIAHCETDSTRRSHHRTDRFDDRVPVMERWAGHVTGADR